MSSRSRSERKPGIAVRRATRADAGAIATLARKLNQHQRDPTHHFTKAALLRDGFGRAPQFTVFLAEIGGRAKGYALVVASYETGWAERGLYLQDLYVSGDVRRQGVAHALVAAVAHEAKRRGGDYVWCAAKIWNREAQAAYRAMGAVEEKVMTYAWVRRNFARFAREGAPLKGAPKRPKGRS